VQINARFDGKEDWPAPIRNRAEGVLKYPLFCGVRNYYNSIKIFTVFDFICRSRNSLFYI